MHNRYQIWTSFRNWSHNEDRSMSILNFSVAIGDNYEPLLNIGIAAIKVNHEMKKMKLYHFAAMWVSNISIGLEMDKAKDRENIYNSKSFNIFDGNGYLSRPYKNLTYHKKPTFSIKQKWPKKIDSLIIEDFYLLAIEYIKVITKDNSRKRKLFKEIFKQ